MSIALEPIAVQSLKQACMTQLEGLILSGEFDIDERLPAERELAEHLNVSRPVVHEALVEMAVKGLVSIQPRRGVFVNDYRKHGSCAILSSLLNYTNGDFDQELSSNMIDMRLLLESETARLAAKLAAPEQIAELREILEEERATPSSNINKLVELDFDFHLTLAVASGNRVYPLIINSFKNVYTNLTRKFFEQNSRETIQQVFDYHQKLLNALNDKNEQSALTIITEMLNHGSRHI